MEIYQKAFDIIERYFGTEEEDKDVRIINDVSDVIEGKTNLFSRLHLLLMQINFHLEETPSSLSRDSTSNEKHLDKKDYNLTRWHVVTTRHNGHTAKFT